MAKGSGLLGDVLDYLQDPNRTQQVQGLGGLLQSAVSNVGESQNKWRDLQARAFADKGNPLKVTDPAALEELTNMTMAGPMSFAQAGITKKAPQQAALDLAQQRAALPVEQGGLGLPANNTPEMRAQAMGFVDELFHGTQRAPEGILEFGGQTGYAGQKGSKANWFTTDPEQASLYANIIRGAGNPTVYPVKIKSGTQISEDAFSNLAGKLNLDQNPEISLYNKKLQKKLQKQGFDEMTFNPGQTEEQYKVVFNPANIRSRFAAFDPFRKDVATATAMGVALPDLLAAEPTPEELQRRQSASLLFP